MRNFFPYTNLPPQKKVELGSRAAIALNTIQKVLFANGIEVVPVDVTSMAYGQIGTRFGVDIICMNHSVGMDIKLYNLLASHLGISTPSTIPTLKFGFLSRDIQLIDGLFKASITSANHDPISRAISFDVLTYRTLDAESLGLKLVHELLHDLNYDEEQVLSNQYQIFDLVRDEFLPFVKGKVYPAVLEVKDKLFKKISECAIRLPAEFNELYGVLETTHLAGFPIPRDVISCVTVVHPFTGNSVSVTLF